MRSPAREVSDSCCGIDYEVTIHLIARLDLVVDPPALWKEIIAPIMERQLLIKKSTWAYRTEILLRGGVRKSQSKDQHLVTA